MDNNYSMDKLLYLFKKSRNECEEKLEFCAKECGINKDEAFLLLFFGLHPHLNKACDAVNVRGFSKAYVSKAIDSLIKRGYVKVEVNEKDRRYQHIIMTDEVKPILEKLQVIHDEMMNNLKDGITDEEFENFFKVVEKIMKNIEK